MNRSLLVFAALLSALPAQAAGVEEDLAVARKAFATLTQTLAGELRTALSEKGPDGAIGVCKERAPAIAAKVSADSGLAVNRVSPKNRNPKGLPDDWEAAAQALFETRLAAGDKPETLETWEVVTTPSGRQFRYARALVTQPLCLTCHGDANTIPDSVKARLAQDYPLDKATGYSAGSVRGIVSISRQK